MSATTDAVGTALVALDGTASESPEGEILSHTWFLGADVVATGATAEVELPPGDYEIVLVVVDETGTAASDSVAVTVVAGEFDEYSLVIGVSGMGRTIPPAGISLFPAEETVRVQAVALEGSRFVRWSGDIQSDQSSTMIVIDRNLFITAEFQAVAADALPRFFLPWADGASRRVAQGNNGSFSHVGRFAWDFPMPVGTPILAAGAGRIIDMLDTTVREDASVLEITDSANFVTIDHGAGLQSLYAHLDFAGVTVVPGQLVARGQVIGFSGNTGYSTAPHLHYEVLDVTGASAPTGFFEASGEDGVPVEGDEVTSRNILNLDTVDNFTPSPLDPDAFLVNEIEMVGDLPPAHFYYNETDYGLSGRVLDGKTKVCVALVDSETFETVYCDLTDVDEDGSFTIPFRFPAELVGRYYLGVISGNAGAEGVTPLSVLISPPRDVDTRPIAVIDTPNNQFIDFLQLGSLSGISSYSPVDRALNYSWMQVSGPPAAIDGPTAPETQFRLEPGAGIERVSFQLIVFDGQLHSLPAQVDFDMPDNFMVHRIGVVDEVCLSADECPEFEAPPPIVSFSTQVLQGWVELVNAEIGDMLTFTITDPTGEIARTIDARVTDEVPAISFWRFNWTSNGLELLPGPWTATFERNGRFEASLEFRVAP
jgi:murein DD-endopeptidase MepM/ murein hydrolase activator NlpD